MGFSGRAEASRAPGARHRVPPGRRGVGAVRLPHLAERRRVRGRRADHRHRAGLRGDERLSDEDIAAYAKGNEDAFTRRVLTLLVQEEVYAAAAEHYDVQVSDDDVRARIDELLGTDNPDDVYSQLAQQGIGREDVFENVRQQLIRQEIAAAEGKADGLDAAALRARYAEVREGLAQAPSATSRCPDQATATAVLAAADRRPARYAALAAQYPGAYTLPAVESRTPGPGPVGARRGDHGRRAQHGVHHAVPEAGGVVVASWRARSTRRSRRCGPTWRRRPPTPATRPAPRSSTTSARSSASRSTPATARWRTASWSPESGGVVDILEDDAASSATDAPAATPAG